MFDAVVLGLGFVGGVIYLGAYFCLARGWITGSSYIFHGTSICSCAMVATSSAYSEAWPSAVINIVFIVMGTVFVAKKAIISSRYRPTAVVDVAEMTFEADSPELTVAA